MDNNYYHRISRVSNHCIDCKAPKALIAFIGEDCYYEDDQLATVRMDAVSCRNRLKMDLRKTIPFGVKHHMRQKIKVDMIQQIYG